SRLLRACLRWHPRRWRNVESSLPLLLQYFGVALGSEIDIALCSLLSLLLERMEDIDGIGEPGHVDDAVGAGLVSYADFLNSGTNAWHGLPVFGLQAVLHTVELESCLTACIQRK